MNARVILLFIAIILINPPVIFGQNQPTFGFGPLIPTTKDLLKQLAPLDPDILASDPNKLSVEELKAQNEELRRVIKKRDDLMKTLKYDLSVNPLVLYFADSKSIINANKNENSILKRLEGSSISTVFIIDADRFNQGRINESIVYVYCGGVACPREMLSVPDSLNKKINPIKNIINDRYQGVRPGNAVVMLVLPNNTLFTINNKRDFFEPSNDPNFFRNVRNMRNKNCERISRKQ